MRNQNISESLSKVLQEEETHQLIERLVGEDYAASFNIEEFKGLNSFKQRVDYCNNNLTRISSGSGRVVYMIDSEKVLKLAKNTKGVAQNEVEIEYSGFHDISDITARVFDSDDGALWNEMELAKRLTKPLFKQIVGFDWDSYSMVMSNEGRRRDGKGAILGVDPEIANAMWNDDGFCYAMFNFMNGYDAGWGDLTRLNSYGVVKREGQDAVVMIDYGLTSSVYDSYYS
jgi:hypothetical protein